MEIVAIREIAWYVMKMAGLRAECIGRKRGDMRLLVITERRPFVSIEV